MASSFEHLDATSPTVKTNHKSDKRFELQNILNFQILHLIRTDVTNFGFQCMHVVRGLKLISRRHIHSPVLFYPNIFRRILM